MFFKKNFLLIVLTLFLLLSFGISFNSYNKEINDNIIANKEFEKKCDEYKNDYDNEEIQKICNDFQKNDLERDDDVISVYSILVYYNPFLSFVFPWILIIMSSVYFINELLSKGIFKNYITRMNYKSFCLKIYLNAYKPVVSIVFVFLVVFLLSIIMSHGFLNFFDSKIGKYSFLNFILTCLFITILNILTCCNISLIVARFKKNFIVTTVISYICFIVVDLFFEIFLSCSMSYLFGFSDYGPYFNILSLFLIDCNQLFYVIVFVPLLAFVLTFIFSFILFNNKEKMMIDNID